MQISPESYSKIQAWKQGCIELRTILESMFCLSAVELARAWKIFKEDGNRSTV